jgi:hypothetical protein
MLFTEPLTEAQMQKLSMVVSVESEVTSLPRAFELAQNYPNPFNPGTTIEFHLPKSTTVTLKIYNILGTEVQTLLSNEKLNAGVYRFSWIVDDLPAGIYLYQLVTPEYKQTKKMTLLR